MWKKKKIKDLLPPPVKVNHGEYSMILSAHDDNSTPTNTLIDLSLNVIKDANAIDLSCISERIKEGPKYPNIWPGDHYKLLSAFVKVLKPTLIVEIGTATGLSALALKKHLPVSSLLATFDIFDWKDHKNTHLVEEDFYDKRLVQYVDDLSNLRNVNKHKNLLEKADIIFIDATHDGILEKQLITNFETLNFVKNPLIIMDDIRVWTMLKMWRELSFPKLDLTSFGHWSGTGIFKFSKE